MQLFTCRTLGRQLQPHDAHQVLRGYQLRQDQHQQGAAQGDNDLPPWCRGPAYAHVSRHCRGSLQLLQCPCGSCSAGPRASPSAPAAALTRPSMACQHRAGRWGCGTISQVMTDIYITFTDSVNNEIRVSGSYEEEEGQEHGPHQVRGKIQIGQKQMVLPEAEVLN